MTETRSEKAATTASRPQETERSEFETSQSQTTDRLIRRINRLEFSAEVSCRYHKRREAFFDSVHRTINFTLLMLSSAAVVAFVADGLDSKHLVPVFSAMAAALAALDQTFAFSQKARDHRDLFRQFINHIMDLKRARVRGHELVESDVVDLACAREIIESNEPATFVAIYHLARNELIRSRPKPKNDAVKTHQVSPLQRLFGHVCRFSGGD